MLSVSFWSECFAIIILCYTLGFNFHLARYYKFHPHLVFCHIVFCMSLHEKHGCCLIYHISFLSSHNFLIGIALDLIFHAVILKKSTFLLFFTFSSCYLDQYYYEPIKVQKYDFVYLYAD